MIEFRNVNKAYDMANGQNIVLKNVNFKFPERKNIGVLGVNGAGKSTLLRLIAGSEYPDSGRIIRKGRYSWPLGFTGSFHPSLTGIENLRFACRIYNADIKYVTEYVKDFSEIGDYIHEPIKTYSSGMRSRLAFALSMAIDFEVYLVDEIMGVGDQGFQQKCKEAFAAKRENSSIIMVSHSMATIKEYSDVALLLTGDNLEIHDDVDHAIELYNVLTTAST
ncbi:ABC transporter ATP-binding protein [Cocleimonas flava]|uniref:Capsular polysaccharide transport system ATP-binding protein n=1 Tax=Cocleimonas flava TaxID=634765 RepID=A0A4R1ET32_9GAMM|nr:MULTISPECIES: ABC transporter ATP-binding protein [Cocleimonas]MEB8432511.1 ABC transporter ATP-binding protein [Cocleimonas sp. KMM 6892]MEC4715370.1 ABC transporter ATP-binding protein [Cocleimonas sp. KMM 6895]MEC4745011.1 ABC transporter ATP-binding protein [Cocleimonas sp. KMM 6896]TCJ82944.1 capsular polysaccharide transport system ATP-binding protein [Cocleimonas flava]